MITIHALVPLRAFELKMTIVDQRVLILSRVLRYYNVRNSCWQEQLFKRY